jgi:hypothetical protein
MKRIQDKIKDLVEPQAFDPVGNFADDPGRALAAYRFTDVTSDLLSRWLDALADTSRAGGAALALAGARGVGKSHTLAVYGALAGSERLRATVEDSHVATSARRLAGRRCAVVRVERGTRPTLAGEVAAAFSRVFGGSEAQWKGEPAEMLSIAASRASGETLVVLVDTAFNRPARVSRDDGPPLGDLAVAARSSNAFVGLALDDDIADADGANVALAGTYRIDYLDPENLFRVAEQFVLRKKPQGRGTIRDIYNSLRGAVPNFNWSEARFASLYPVHPLVAEVAAGVRLYVPGFAFLPFAAGVAARAAARPALSLVLLDEVFDATEAGLRKAPDLKEVFAAYDGLTASCVNQLPVMLRHQARLILKSLFVLSLDGRGATAGELCAALLLTDELSEAGGAARQVEEILARFAQEAGAGDLRCSTDVEGHVRYVFRTPACEEESELAAHEAATTVADSTVNPAASPSRREDILALDEPELALDAPAPATGHATTRATHTPVEAAPQPVKPAPVAPVVPAAQPMTTESIWADLAADESLWDDKIALKTASPKVVEDGVAAGGAAQGKSQAAPARTIESEAVSNGRGPRDAAEELTAWARLLTGRDSLASIADATGREEVRGALAVWLEEWNASALRRKFEAIPAVRLTTLVGRYEADVSRSFGRAAQAVEDTLSGRVTLEESLERIGYAFRNSAQVFAERRRQLADFAALVEGFARRERLRAYLAHAEATGVDQIETARRELLKVADDPNSLLDAGQRERFEKLWQEFHARYVEQYAGAHDLAVGGGRARLAARIVRRGARWREFESLARLPVMSAQVWRRADELLRQAEEARCDYPVRDLLAERPACACRFRLSRAGSLAHAAEELEALAERGIEVYRRTLLLLGGHLAIGLDALARREADEEEARRARVLSTAFAQSRLPERFTRADVRLIERALRRTPPPPVRVRGPQDDTGLMTRDQLRSRLERWLDELPELPVLIEVVGRGEASVV